MTTGSRAAEHLTPLRINISGRCAAPGHAKAANFLNLYLAAWEHLTKIHHTHPHLSSTKGARRGLQGSNRQDSSSLGWFGSSHRGNWYYTAFPVLTQHRESCTAEARMLEWSCLRTTGGEGRSRSKPNQGENKDKESWAQFCSLTSLLQSLG